MRKINQRVEAQKEAFEYYNKSTPEDKPYWEQAEEDYEKSSYRRGWPEDDWEEEEFFRKQLRDYEKKYFDGKRWEDVDPIIRDVWSDLYKDVHGVRPYHIPFGCIA